MSKSRLKRSSQLLRDKRHVKKVRLLLIKRFSVNMYPGIENPVCITEFNREEFFNGLTMDAFRVLSCMGRRVSSNCFIILRQ
ncbi:MAG: hypothetical protein QXU43_02165 [Thermoproteota archaeon]